MDTEGWLYFTIFRLKTLDSFQIDFLSLSTFSHQPFEGKMVFL